MNLERLKEIIVDYHEVIRSFDIIPREYQFEENANYVLVGLRRSGKSTILFDIIHHLILKGVEWNQIIYINFEDERLIEFTVEDFNKILQAQTQLSEKKGYYFFDEIQNIEGWERFARRLADAKERVYITGSNAQMLSREIESRLGGRYLTQIIYPYNFREYLLAQQIDYSEASLLSTRLSARILQASTNYLQNGGFPESLLYSVPRTYVENIYQKILLGDIIIRNEARRPQALRLLVKKIAETIRTEVSYRKLKNAIESVGENIGLMTLIDYIHYLKDAFLIFSIPNYITKFEDRESNPKYYFSDNGLLNLFLFDKVSALLENLVGITLYKKYGLGLFFFKSKKTGIDVDFYVPEEKLAIQVAYSLSESSIEREISNLVKLGKSMTQINRLVVITLQEERLIEDNNQTIEVIPLHKFLLMWD